MDKFRETLVAGARELGVELDNKALELFGQFTDEMLEWNKVMNLTAITAPEDIALKHYVDSLAILKYVNIENGAKIADVGCGAGFPGVPLKIARDDIDLCSVDSLGKRVNFLTETEKKLGLKNCRCIHARAEEVGQKAPFRESFDYSTARAVAKLRVLVEYCLPLVKVGGAFIAMKGGDAGEEIKEAENAVKTLGGKIESIFEYTLPLTDNRRTIIVIRKTAQTDRKYPRPSAKIAKNPL